MKKFAKIIAIVLVLAMVAAFAACGKKKDDSKFAIGLIGPLTGAAATYGQAAKNGAELAVKQINEQAEKDGTIQIDFRAEDDAHDPEKSVSAYNTLKDWGMQALVGPVTTNPAKAVAAKANEDKIFCLTPSASSADVTKDNDVMYQVCFSDPNQGKESAKYIAENYKDKNVGVIYENDDPYSKGIYDAFKAELAAQGGKLVYEGSFTEDTSTDFKAQVNAAKEKAVDVLFLPIYYTPASVILNQSNEISFKPVFFGVDGMDGILDVQGFDTKLAEGVLLLTPFNAWSDESKDFVDAYKAAYDGAIPNQFAADAYDAVYIIYNLMRSISFDNGETAGKASASDVCAKMQEAMKTYTYTGLTGKDMKWDAEGAVNKLPVVYVIKDSKYQLPNA